MWRQIMTYFEMSGERYFTMLGEHIRISLCSLAIAAAVGVLAGVFCVRFNRVQKAAVGVFSVLRIIPSLAILLLMLPLFGTGVVPAVSALVLLAIPPVLINTISGLESVPKAVLETAEGLGMEEKEIWKKVRFPLALPLILAGIKTSAVEIIASATLAAKIGAGGLGDIIFTGIGLFRTDLLLIGGVSVAALSVLTGILFGRLENLILKYRKVYSIKKKGRIL